jgi:magnesium chelatase subunit H
MVNEVVSTGGANLRLSVTWKGRNVYSYGRNEGGVAGTARPEVLDKLLATERIVQD